MFLELQPEELLIKFAIFTGVFGNFCLVFVLSSKLRIPSAGYILLLSLFDAVILATLCVFLMKSLTFDVLYSHALMACVQSSICKIAALITERMVLELRVEGTYDCTNGDISGKNLLYFITVCATVPCAIILYISKSLELDHEWRVLLLILEVLFLYVFPLTGMGFFVARITHLKKTEMALSEKTASMQDLHEDRQEERRFTSFVVCMSLVSFVTYPIFAAALVVGNMFPKTASSEITSVISILIILECGINVFIYVFTLIPENPDKHVITDDVKILTQKLYIA